MGDHIAYGRFVLSIIIISVATDEILRAQEKLWLIERHRGGENLADCAEDERV
jgi:hypothetical protein